MFGINTLKRQVKQLQSDNRRMERDIFDIQNPAKFKSGDEVIFKEGKWIIIKTYIKDGGLIAMGGDIIRDFGFTRNYGIFDGGGTIVRTESDILQELGKTEDCIPHVPNGRSTKY